jgi:predicted transcriptional regulator
MPNEARMKSKEAVRLNVLVSPELNERLERMAAAEHSTKTEILKKALALFDVAHQAKAEDKAIGVFDKATKQIQTEIVGL